jgi:hypothetical protein
MPAHPEKIVTAIKSVAIFFILFLVTKVVSSKDYKSACFVTSTILKGSLYAEVWMEPCVRERKRRSSFR